MQVALIIATAISAIAASPSGYYHQEYNYKTSSSSFKNNELQHKTDDQGYYSKDGDLEGKVRPKVSSNSEHSEYVNPNLRDRANAGYYDAGSELTSHGNMLANSYGASLQGQASSGYRLGGSQYENNMDSEGLASSKYIAGASKGYGSYHSGSEASYESANLQTIASRLQNDLQHELQTVMSQSHQTDIAALETDLRRNLTERLNEILQERFGTQTIRGGQSYSLTDGRLEARPNYEQQELDQLRRQVESTLLSELRQGYNYRSSHSSQRSSNQENFERYESTTTYRPGTYRPIYPSLNVIGPQEKYPTYGVGKDAQYQYQTNRVSSSMEYSQAPDVVSITTIASNVQRDLNNQLNRLLEEAQSKYFSENARYASVNTAQVLERLKQELRSNLTYTLEDELRRTFGTQMQRNGYMFSAGTGGQIGNQYNYNIADLENLRRQVEDNLISKLTRDFETARQHWVSRQQHSQSQQTYYGQSNDYRYGGASNQRYQYSTTPRYIVDDYATTPRYIVDDYYRPTSASIVPLISSGIKGQQYHGASGSQYSNFEAASGSSNLAQLQKQMQTDLSSQLQAALSQNKAYMSRYSSAADSRASFEEAYRRLYDELQRNLTQQLQSFEAGSSGYSNTFGGVNENQLAQLRSQLQSNLASQLQQGLQQSYSASASYSASSSGSSSSAGAGAYSSSNTGGYYRAARGSDAYQYGQYRAGGGYLMEGEDCQGQGEDAYLHQFHRGKRSYGYRSRPLGLSTYGGTGYDTRGTYGGASSYGGYSQVGQEQDNSELVQSGRGYSTYANQGGQFRGQEIDDTDETQQVEVDPEFGQASNFGGHFAVGQEVDNFDTQQRQVNNEFGQTGLSSQNDLQLGSQLKPLTNPGQQPIQNNRDTTQLIQNNRQPSHQGNLNLAGGATVGRQRNNHLSQQGYLSQYPSYNSQLGQEIDDTDTQQIEDINFGNLDIANQYKPSSPEQRPLDSSNISNIETLEVENSNASQQSPKVSQPNTGYINQPNYFERDDVRDNRFFGQETDNIDNTQPSGLFKNERVSTIKPNYSNSGRYDGPNINSDSEVPKRIDINSPGTNKPNYFEKDYIVRTNPSNNDDENTQQVETEDFNLNLNNPKQQQLDTFDSSQNTEIENENNGNRLSTPRTQVYLKPDNSNDRNVYSPNDFGQNPDNSHTKVTDRPVINNFGPQDQLGQPDNFHLVNKPKPLSQIGQEIDDSDTYFQPLNPTSTSVNQLKPNQFNTNLNGAIQHNTNTGNFQRGSITPQFGIQNVLPDAENVEPLIDPFENSFSSTPLSILPSSQRPIIEPQTLNSAPVQPFTRSTTQPSVFVPNGLQNSLLTDDFRQNPPINIPPKLTTISLQLEDELTKNIENIVKNDLPYSLSPTELYKTSLNDLRLNITYECQKLLTDRKYSYLNLQQEDITLLEQYIEAHLVAKLASTFSQSGYFRGEVNYDFQNQNSFSSGSNYNIRNSYGPNYRQRPNAPVSSNTFLQGEINSQYPAGQFSDANKPLSFGNSDFPSGNQIGSDSLVTSRNPVQSSTPQTLFGVNNWLTTTVQPVVSPQWQNPQVIAPNNNPSWDAAERDADILIQNLRNSLQNRRIEQNSFTSDNTFRERDRPIVSNQHQPEYEVIQVKLENITPEQYSIINQIENDFYNILDVAIEKEFASNALSESSTYEQYRKSVNKLEQEIKRNLSECIIGKTNAEYPQLNKYSTLVYRKFEFHKISDVQKYLEIRLIKKIRAQLKKVYNIEPYENTYPANNPSNPEVAVPSTPLSSENRRIIKLENITPEQLNVITKIEDDIFRQIEAAIQIQVNALKQNKVSDFYFQDSLKTLEAELKNNITESVQRLCEPGFSQYPELVSSNFDMRKINDLEQYLQIKLNNKLRENIIFYSTVNFSSGSHISSSHSLHYAHHYNSNSYQNTLEGNHGPTENLDEGVQGAISPKPFSQGGYVKGGARKTNKQAEDVIAPEVDQSLQSNPDVELVNLVKPVTPEPIEVTTPSESWWKKFGNKVKQGANHLKDKIVGNS